MTKMLICRVANESQKDFRESEKALLKVQGLGFLVDFERVKAQKVENIAGFEIENAMLYKIDNGVNVDVDDLTNLTKENRKALKSGSISSANAKYNGLNVIVTYNQSEKEFYCQFDIVLLLYF